MECETGKYRRKVKKDELEQREMRKTEGRKGGERRRERRYPLNYIVVES